MSECESQSCENNADDIKDIFVLSSRRGRRNAMHEYSMEHIEATAHQLTSRFSEIETNCEGERELSQKHECQQPIPSAGAASS
uniref:CACTA en-spm transposon protein n=1 Tax=Strongyloides papillosus TaxID=174720 RepID=A0A0N5BIT1_STREA